MKCLLVHQYLLVFLDGLMVHILNQRPLNIIHLKNIYWYIWWLSMCISSTKHSTNIYIKYMDIIGIFCCFQCVYTSTKYSSNIYTVRRAERVRFNIAGNEQRCYFHCNQLETWWSIKVIFSQRTTYSICCIYRYCFVLFA